MEIIQWNLKDPNCFKSDFQNNSSLGFEIES